LDGGKVILTIVKKLSVSEQRAGAVQVRVMGGPLTLAGVAVDEKPVYKPNQIPDEA